ncbi:hypothetical protein DW932_18055 [Bacteroides intestinalis]|uniref:hypothetical protein n=1 Tax=Bacteroides intestinalis TaxID=329854 RepID=UPI000E5463C3|nr:hypothetical protein [Bacteroides intestinalis]RHA57616.1 hypothetical protein DW932_18055 [Bacteroides intestinalis]DAJ80765.1 MAG TPA: tail protein [Caudoviricetes sp.]
MAGIINTGSPYTGSVKRTNPKPLDSSSAIDSYENAKVYAANVKGEDVPYPGQIIATEGKAYILKVDPEMPDESANEIYHCKLDELGGTSTLDKRYLLRDVAETVEKLMTFLEGINVKGMATLEEITLLRDIVSQNFAKGSTGFGIYKDEAGIYHLDIDFVNVRRKLTADEIQVQRSYYVGGKQWVTPGGGIYCTSVEDIGSAYRCHFKSIDADGREVKCLFQTDDRAICETFNLDKKVGGVLGNHYYWRLVVGVGTDYIDLSKSNCGAGSDAPLAGDEIVHLGNKSDKSRQGAICSDAITTGGPYIRVYEGISDYHLPQPNIDLNPEESIIKAKLISIATGKDIDTVLEDMQDRIELVKKQTDKEYTLWFFDYVPTLSNIPASEWNTPELKAMHDQDMFYNRLTGKGYRFESGTWNEITDHLTLKALEDAAKAQDTADGKRRVFVEQPTKDSEYDIGDLWVNATYNDGTTIYKNDSLVCKTAKAKGAAFSISHWGPSSSATTAYLENLGDQIVIAVTDSNEGIKKAKDLAQQGINDASNAAKSAAEALGIAQGAKSAATENTTVIQATKESLTLLAQGIHFDASGEKITNINTSGLITTADFSALYGKEIVYDKDGHVDMTKMSGIITKDGLTEMFSSLADNNGYVRKAYIDLFVTQLPDKSFQSNAVINADQIRFNGNIVANDTFVVDTEGNLTLNKITATNGVFNGTLSGVSGTFSELSAQFTDGEYVLSTSITPREIEIGKNESLGALLNLRAEFVSNTWGGVMVLKGNVRGIKSKISIGYEHIFITSQDMEAPPKSVEISPDGIKFYYNGVLTKSYSAT